MVGERAHKKNPVLKQCPLRIEHFQKTEPAKLVTLAGHIEGAVAAGNISLCSIPISFCAEDRAS